MPNPTSPALSVVICTYNRRELVERAVRSLMVQTRPAESFEVILVDNNSKDDTFAWAQNFRTEFPSLRALRESNQGLSFARNRGIQEANAPIVGFLDDDAVAVPEWVDALLVPFEQDGERPVAVGGRIELEWVRPRPPWLPDSAQGWLGYFTLPADQRTLRPGIDNLRGGNMAVEREVLSAGAFNTRLGRSSSGLMGNEEVELQRRLEALGRPMRYAHDAVIYHRVHPDRLTARWMFRRAWDQGRSDVHLDEVGGAVAQGLVGAGFRAWSNGVRAALVPRTRRRVHFALRATMAAGALVEGARRSLGASRDG